MILVVKNKKFNPISKIVNEREALTKTIVKNRARLELLCISLQNKQKDINNKINKIENTIKILSDNKMKINNIINDLKTSTMDFESLTNMILNNKSLREIEVLDSLKKINNDILYQNSSKKNEIKNLNNKLNKNSLELKSELESESDSNNESKSDSEK